MASFLPYLVLVFLPALIITTVTGQWASIPLLSWIIVAVGIAAIHTLGTPWAQAAAGNVVSLHRALACEEEIRRLMVWHQGRYDVRIFSPVGRAIALGIILVKHLLQHNRESNAPKPLLLTSRQIGLYCGFQTNLPV